MAHNSLDIRVTTAIDSMRPDDLNRLEQARGSHGEARFSVTRHGYLTVLTGPLKRDNCVVRFFRGLGNAAYRARDAEIKLARNVEFQRRIAEKALSLSGSVEESFAYRAPDRLADSLRNVLSPGRPHSRDRLSPDQLRLTYESAVHIDNMMKWGESLAWFETRIPSGPGLISAQLAEAPEDVQKFWRQNVSRQVNGELKKDPALAGLMTAAAREAAEQGRVSGATLEAIRALVQQKTAEVIQRFSTPLGAPDEARTGRAADDAVPAGSSRQRP